MDGSNSIMGTTKVESLSDSKVDDSLTIKLLCYSRWNNKNGESYWQQRVGSEEPTTSTYVRECNIWYGHDRTNMKTSQNRKGGKCKKVNTNGHLKENTVRDKTTQTCYATRQPSGVRMWHTTMQMRGLCSNTVHSHQGEEKLCLRSRQPSRELVREERKRSPRWRG